jgi:ABC-type branched-subunit amino acid transport system permease subunit
VDARDKRGHDTVFCTTRRFARDRPLRLPLMPPVFGVLFDGLAYGMLLFLLSVGLSVTLGMMNFVNLAHCSFAMLGGYVTVTLMNALGWPFLATLPIAFVAAAAASVVLERVFFRRFYRASDLEQCLLTIGVVFVSIAAAAYIYGTDQQPLQLPAYLRGSFVFAGLNFSAYRLSRRCGRRSTINAWRAGLASMSMCCSPSRSRSAAGLRASAARSRSPWSGSIRPSRLRI